MADENQPIYDKGRRIKLITRKMGGSIWEKKPYEKDTLLRDENRIYQELLLISLTAAKPEESEKQNQLKEIKLLSGKTTEEILQNLLGYELIEERNGKYLPKLTEEELEKIRKQRSRITPYKPESSGI